MKWNRKKGPKWNAQEIKLLDKEALCIVTAVLGPI